MSDQEFVIEVEDDAEGHAFHGTGIVEADDTEWLAEKLRSDSGTKRLRVLPDDRDDTEGHVSDILVRAMLEDEDDTEGHAIAIHFPSRKEADAFRRRLLVTGVLVGTVALGAAGGVGLSALQSDDGATGAGAAQSSVTGSDWSQAERPLGAQQAQPQANFEAAAAAEGERQGAASAARAEANSNSQEAAAAEGERQGAASAARAEANSNSQEAAAAEGERQGGTDATANDSGDLKGIGRPTPR